MTNRLAWLVTPKGRTFSFGCMCTASVVAFAVNFIPETFALSKYKEIVCLYESSQPVVLAESVMKRWNKVLGDLRYPKQEIKYLDPFPVFGFDLFRAGTVCSRWGAIIGIPINFTYTDTKTINPESILVNNEQVNWNREDAKTLLDSLVLTEDAQCYGIARELLMAKHNMPTIRSCLAAFMVSSSYLLGRGINEKLNLLAQPRGTRMVFYTIVLAFSYGIWAIQTDIGNVFFEREADMTIAQLGDNYKKGAIEFYEKQMKRNIALRTLLGPSGEDVYTSTGTEKFLLRQPTISIDERKDFFVDSLNPKKPPAEADGAKQAAAEVA